MSEQGVGVRKKAAAKVGSGIGTGIGSKTPKIRTKSNKIKSKQRKRSTIRLASKKINDIDKNYCFVKFVCYLMMNLSKYLENSVIKQYLIFMGVDPSKLIDEVSHNYYVESRTMARALGLYPTITKQIYTYILTNESKLEFLQKYSDEQIKYITSLDMSDSKVIACAGSGKTRSIIGRIKFMVEHNFAEKEEIFAITFARKTADDFRDKILGLFPNYANFCCLKNFSTIDSLAKSILCKVKSHKSENVEILSIALRNYLKEISNEEINLVRRIKNIKYLFIDEAQDLNDVQNDIIMLLKEKFGTKINMIGDGNQNIYQFRRSCSKYFLNFDAIPFEFTKNFRSTQEIIDFSENFKSVPTSKSISATGKHGKKVTIITKPAQDIHQLILHFIKLYGSRNDLSNVAIICPTRGIGTYDTVGLSVFFNFLKMNKIPFNQLYDESGLNDERRLNKGKVAGHINLLTYHGTKGLEFDVVFVMDFYNNLFNIKPTEEEHRIAKYLLYVATSRAINLMFICTYTNVHGGYLNHWISHVPAECYFSDSALKIPKLSFREENIKPMVHGITELIGQLSDEQLDMIHDMLKVEETKNLFTRRIYRDFTHIDRGKDETLFGIFCEELFYLQHHLARSMNPRKLPIIEMIINSKFVVVDDDNDFKKLKNYISKNKLNWEKYDMVKNSIPERVRYLIEKYYTRDREINEFMVCTSEFVKIVELNRNDIIRTYARYLNSDLYDRDYNKILTDFFYLIVVQYAYDINHYYYIADHGIEKHDLLYNGSELFEEINKYASYNYLSCSLNIKINVNYPKLMLMGEIDFMERYYYDSIETIVEIKCVREISIKYYLQLMLYNFCYYCGKNQPDKLFYNSFKIVNLLTGLEHRIIISISPTNMFNLLIILADVGNLVFDNLNLVYDLETTDKIKTIGPFDYKPVVPRSSISRKANKYYGNVYPEITEIAIKDYETGMVLIDSLVKPSKEISLEVQKLTGITTGMVASKPNIDKIRFVMENKMKKFNNCKMLAHNGNNFDDKIILYDKLIDPQKVSFMDTISLIPIHLPLDMKLENKSLGKIYHQLFNKNFNAHRAMADVNALIEIMKYLKIQL